VFEKRPHLLRDLAFYVLISLGVVAITVICALNAWGTGWGRWMLLTLATSLIFYYWIKACRPLWRHKLFWVTVMALAALHTTGWLFVMRHSAKLQPSWPVALAEYVALTLLAGWIHPIFKNRHTDSKELTADDHL